jgi:L-seryl-tRNA(Ser) seleniumtransferase
MENRLRQLPSVDKILGEDRIKALESIVPRTLLVELVREQLEKARHSIIQGNTGISSDDIVAGISQRVHHLTHISLRKVINATGVVLHTNLGRAPLSEKAIAAMDAVSRGYTNLEFDIEKGDRGSRHTHVEPLLCLLSGAEAALVVNNNAAAVLLVLTALAKRKEVIVSRGQAVEIGGGFRIPDVMRQSGAKLVEVGTTNCTYIRDFEQAITPQTAAILRVHSSNFKVVGFTQMTTLEEMVELGKKYNLPVFDDLGSGCPLDTTQFGLDPEPTIRESISQGATLAFFSGDKLLGGPQSGIIAGKKDYIDKLKKHALVRAMRIDKTRLAGLAATIIHYLKGEALTAIPVWQMISLPLSEIDRRAHLWADSLEGKARVIDGESVIGGGSLPGGTLPTRLLAIGNERTAKKLAENLRRQEPPVIGRVSENTLLLDPRTVSPQEDESVIQALHQAITQIKL